MWIIYITHRVKVADEGQSNGYCRGYCWQQSELLYLPYDKSKEVIDNYNSVLISCLHNEGHFSFTQLHSFRST